MKKRSKGEWGYIRSQRIRVLIMTVILYICALGLYLIGYCTLHTRKSLWTIFAILSVLPASKSLVNLIMFMRFKSLTAEIHDRIHSCAGQLAIIYELPFTTYEKTYFVDAIACAGNSAAGCYLGKPSGKKSHDQDLKDLCIHLENVLKNDGYKDFTLKIFDNIDDFTDRLKEMDNKLSTKRSVNDEGMLNTFRAVSL